MVRLKENRTFMMINKYSKFQFLMVRLKDLRNKDLESVEEISIPYGAIKRERKERVDRFTDIFQFLMVRLKVNNMSQLSEKNAISIPYGAIKSGEFKTEFESYTKFQFLMVRLKVHRSLHTSLHL